MVPTHPFRRYMIVPLLALAVLTIFYTLEIAGADTNSGVLVYGEGNETTPRYRTWNGTSFDVEASAQAANSTISWSVLKSSPVSNEIIMGVYASGDKKLYIQTWDGSSWTANWDTHLNADGQRRVFDIAYERSSGDAIVVFGDRNTNTLKYRKRVSGTWDSANQDLMTPDDEVYWVRAESRPTNDDVFVGAAAKSKSLYAMRWDGANNTWGDQIQTTSGLKSETREGFGIAFERASGDAFLIWGDDAKNLKYREFSTSWQSEATAYASMADDVFWLAAASDPAAGSSKIAIGMVMENTTFEFGAWDGSSWVTRPASISARNRDQRGIDVAFESATGEAVYIFNQDANKQQMAWRTWTSSGGFSGVNVEAGSSDDINFMQLQADPNSSDMVALYCDKNRSLFHRKWNGSSWSALDTALEIDISDEDKNEAFMFAWTKVRILVLDEHTAGQVSDKFSDTSQVTDVLFRFSLSRILSVTVDTLRVNFTTDGGVTNGDVSSGELWQDTDNDGEVDDPGDTLVQGSVAPSGGVLAFTTDFTPATDGTNYLVRATVSNLAEGDTTTFSVSTDDIDEVESGVTESGATADATHSVCTQPYTYRRTLTIDADRISASCTADLTDFPVLVSLTGDWLKTTSADPEDGHIQHNLGYDIIFKALDDDTCGGVGLAPCTLDHEIEKYNGTTGTLVAWVRIPSLAYDADTDIEVHYGNSCTVAATENPTAVWDDDYEAVWHLDEEQSETGTEDLYQDSTENYNHGDDYVSATGQGGQIDGGQEFDGADDHVAVPDSTSLQVIEMTLEAWVKIPGSIPSGFRSIIEHARNTTNWYGLWKSDQGNMFHFRWSTGTVRRTDFNATISPDTWYYVVGVLDPDVSEAYTYLNGDLDKTVTSASSPTAASGVVSVGSNSGSGEPFDGFIDEVRISSIARDGCWIETTHHSQGDPTKDASCTDSGFVCLGSEQSHPPAVNLVSLSGSSMTPQTEHTVTVNVSDLDGKANLDTLVLKVYYDGDGGAPTDVEAEAQTADTQNTAIITWTQSTDTFSIDPSGAGTTWSLGASSSPDSLPGDFTFVFTPGKVASETTGSAVWQLWAKVTDDQGTSDTNYDETPPTMNWYGEIIVNTSSVDWGTVDMGSDFSANPQTDVSVTYISNGNYNQQVKSDGTWSGSASIALNAAGSPGAGEFSVKANEVNDLNTAELVSTGYATIDAGSQTDESGNTEGANALWLRLGASSIPAVTYDGTIYYQIAQ